MSVSPNYAYYAGMNHVTLPYLISKELTPEELVNYKNFSKEVLDYAPRNPPNINPQDKIVDYLVYDTSDNGTIPQYNFLFNSSDKRIPGNFEQIYLSNKSVVYRINW
jgi:hypothetical protein